MHKLLSAAIVATLSLSAAVALAGPQQEKMKHCQKEATDKGLKGPERQKFVNECLKNKPADAPAAGDKKDLPPREAMSACAKSAKEKGLKGPDHKKYMSECLKAKGPANLK
ncbi:MAG: hypothetical protein HY902_08140 [Deltaproteobacteria bacterium]|nr:hypothetical protein [Deltaproteobacteria bacterium]